MKSSVLHLFRRWLATAAAPLFAFASVPVVINADRDIPRPSPKATSLALTSTPVSADNATGRLLFEENLGQHAKPVRYKLFGGEAFLTDRAEACMLVEVVREPLWRPKGKAAQNPMWRKAPASRPIYRALRMQPVERETGRPVPPAPSEGLVRSPIKLSYCKGDRASWRSNVPLYRQVVYHNVYAGIDLVYYPKDERLTYDFRVAPGADPSAIQLHFDGADRLALDREGNLQCFVAGQTVVMQRPTLYQEIAGERRLVPGRFALSGNDVSFEVGAYDRNLALVIDPALPFYSSYFGGSQDDQAVGVAVGRIYNRSATTSDAVFSSPDTIPVFIGGTTFSPSLPVPVGTGPNANNPFASSDVDIFVARFEFRADGTAPTSLTDISATSRFAPWNDFANGMYANFTYDDRGAERGLAAVVIYGGSGDDVCTAVSVNASQNDVEEVTTPSSYFRPSTGPVLVGYTTSADFPCGRLGLGDSSPTTFQSTFGGGATDAFALLLPFCLDVAADNITTDPVAYGTYIGGSGDDIAWACVAQQSTNGQQFVLGGETTGSLPTGSASGPVFDGVYGGGGDGFVGRFNPALNSGSAQRRYLTYFGGSDYDAITGVSNFNSGSPRVGVTGLTLSNPESSFIDASSGAVSSAVSGSTRAGSVDAFVAIFSGNTGPTRTFSTYLGGGGDDWGIGIYARRRTVDGDSRYVVHVAGLTDSQTAGFGVPSSGGFSTANKGGRDAFVTQIRWDDSLSSPTRVVQYFGYLGTPSDDDAYALATSQQSGPGNSIVYVGGFSSGATLLTPVGTSAGCPTSVSDMLYPTPFGGPPPPTVPAERGFLARISPVNEDGTNLPATLQTLVNVGGRTFVSGAQPIQYVLGIAPYLVAGTGNSGTLFFTGTTNTDALLPSAPPLSIGPINCLSPTSIPFNVFQSARANNASDRKDAFLGSVRLTP
ncbi:MAG: hypothetical protein CFK52_07010 [Chloracidobacterium sp. CP2_5A]|nr:MAG: hypothetical protein CFK52_07010 [Chloracidobacterium sp. CP2_5A]